MNRTRTLVTAGAIAAAMALPLAPASAGQPRQALRRPRHRAVRRQDTRRLRPVQPVVRWPAGKVSGLTGDASLVGIDFRVQDKRALRRRQRRRRLHAVLEGDRPPRSASSPCPCPARRSASTSTRRPTACGWSATTARTCATTSTPAGHDLDGTLTYPPATAPASGVSAAAYTNNDLDAATATTLFDLDTALDQVAIQAPANAGSLSATGKLGVDAGSDAGFDIAGKGNQGYATLSVGGKYRLYTSRCSPARSPPRAASPLVQVSDLAVPIGK